ncbi:GNAT family N-acetyltransferase [Sinorhizobium sp. RAC02]|uniref:GNAT family N-acetyltransferase n=1 Tax=Sinorhizobium sp. RAC02 TaxID=1842534 RepID=UPI00083DF952|nr:GNAT family N-acetyltransferase [Sinorhizobium sp. RAC02]AOF90311.1 acetyltransferase family protein [Sinorhizobium sp. RAC02]
MQVVFLLFTRDDLLTLRKWFEDKELLRRLSFPDDEWFAYVTNGDTARCWMAYRSDEAIAEIQVDRDGEHGYIELAVRPDLRGCGIGTAVLSTFLAGPGKTYMILDARIDPDNSASLACFLRCGFEIRQNPDVDGFIQAVRQQASGP